MKGTGDGREGGWRGWGGGEGVVEGRGVEAEGGGGAGWGD